MADRQKRWDAILVDLEWIATVAETEKNRQLVADIRSQLLTPAAFSAVK